MDNLTTLKIKQYIKFLKKAETLLGYAGQLSALINAELKSTDTNIMIATPSTSETSDIIAEATDILEKLKDN